VCKSDPVVEAPWVLSRKAAFVSLISVTLWLVTPASARDWELMSLANALKICLFEHKEMIPIDGSYYEKLRVACHVEESAWWRQCILTHTKEYCEDEDIEILLASDGPTN
jgi:hypothetical protein